MRMRTQTLWKRLPLMMLLVILLVSLWCVSVSAADERSLPGAASVRVTLDGKEILSGRVGIMDSLTYVPLREFCNQMGVNDIRWDGSSHTAYAKGGGVTLSVKDGARYIVANERYLYTGQPVRNLNGRLYVPIRPLAKALGLEVSWNGSTRTVALTRTGRVLTAGSRFYDADDLYWLSRIISAEAGAESLLGQIAVGNVILNRVNSSQYPNSVYGVIFDRRHGIQFTPAATGSVHKTPTASAVIAAKICLEGYSLSEEMLYFLNPRIATNFWIVNNCRFVMRIGRHDFYA